MYKRQALKIEQKTFKQADGTEVVKYMPIALKDSGKVTVTATFEKNKKPLDGVSAQFEFNLSKDDNIIPFTSQTMYQVFSGKEEGALTKACLLYTSLSHHRDQNSSSLES